MIKTAESGGQPNLNVAPSTSNSRARYENKKAKRLSQCKATTVCSTKVILYTANSSCFAKAPNLS